MCEVSLSAPIIFREESQTSNPLPDHRHRLIIGTGFAETGRFDGKFFGNAETAIPVKV